MVTYPLRNPSTDNIAAKQATEVRGDRRADGRWDGRIAGKGLARGERASFILFKDTGQTGDRRQRGERCLPEAEAAATHAAGRPADDDGDGTRWDRSRVSRRRSGE